MADPTYGPKVYDKQGGDELVIAAGGTLNVETGGVIKANGTQGAALTAQLTTITFTAPGTPDYAIQTLVNSGGYGFVTSDEAQSALAVIANLQARVAQLEARLQGVGLIP